MKAAIWIILLTGCIQAGMAWAEEGTALYPGVPISSIYDVAVTEGNSSQLLTVFQSSCPTYQPGYQNMKPVDSHPLEFFKGRSISWARFCLSNEMTVRIHILDSKKVPTNGRVRIFPSRYGVTPVVSGDEISFTVTQPGQYSVEMGDNGYKNGLLIFVSIPPETDKASDPAAGNYYTLTNATAEEINAVPATYGGIYFKQGVHDIGGV